MRHRPSATVTTAPGAGARRRSRTACPSELVGSQTTRSGMSATDDRQGDRPAAVRHGQAVAVGDADRGGRGGRQPGDRRGGGAGQVRLAVLQPTVVEQQLPGGQDGLVGAAAARGSPGGYVRARPTRAPSQGPSAAISARTAAAVAQPEGHAQLVGEQVAAPGRRAARWSCSTASNGADPALPVEERAGLLGRGGDRAARRRRARSPAVSRSSRPTTNAGCVERGQGRGRVGQVVGVDAADDAAPPSSPAAAAATMLAGVAAGAARAGSSTPQAVGDVDAGGRRRRPGGRRAAGRAARRPRPRRARRPGAAPRPARAPVACGQRGRGGSAPRQRSPAARRPG